MRTLARPETKEEEQARIRRNAEEFTTTLSKVRVKQSHAPQGGRHEVHPALMLLDYPVQLVWRSNGRILSYCGNILLSGVAPLLAHMVRCRFFLQFLLRLSTCLLAVLKGKNKSVTDKPFPHREIVPIQSIVDDLQLC